MIKASCSAASEFSRQHWFYRRYWICIVLDGEVVTYRLNLYSAWRRYLNFYSSVWSCGIPLPSSTFIAINVTCTNGLVAVYMVSINRFGLFDTHVGIWVRTWLNVKAIKILYCAFDFVVNARTKSLSTAYLLYRREIKIRWRRVRRRSH